MARRTTHDRREHARPIDRVRDDEPDEERAALDQLRATVAEAARGAATTLIRERIDANADEALIGEAIKGIGSR